MVEKKDLTRWNRAGLSTFEYVDGNAAIFLELLRQGLNESFPHWRAAQSSAPADEDAAARKDRLEKQYLADPDDMLWQMNRQLARACHVLAGHIDAYANEAYIGTASQWDNVRRLVALLDYAPQPPASAYTPLVLHAKKGVRSTLKVGFQVKNEPKDGSLPVIFETLEPLTLDSSLNSLRPEGYDRNPQPLSGTTLELENNHDLKADKIKTGEPLILEDTRSGRFAAYLVRGIREKQQTTVLSISPALSGEFVTGHTLVHLEPKEKLAPLGPETAGAEIGQALQLIDSTGNLAAGEVVIIGSPGKKPYYKRLKKVQGNRLVFEDALGDLTIKHATVSRVVEVPVAQHGKRTTTNGAVLDTVYVAGDWTRLAGKWLADQRLSKGIKRLPMYQVFHAKYVPVGTENLEEDDKEGYTALTLKYHPDDDRVPGNENLSLKNPQILLAPPVNPGPWRADSFLQKSNAGHLPEALVTKQGKKTSAGDYAVVVQGSQTAWSKLGQVEVDLDYGESTLKAQSGWQDRGGGPFYLSQTRIFTHFNQHCRLNQWQKNATPIAGFEMPLDHLPDALTAGRVLIVQTDKTALKTRVKELRSHAGHHTLIIEDRLPDGTTIGNLIINGNVTTAGHGETRPQRVLGSGNATLGNQSFVLPQEKIAFVPDATQSSGVRADLDLQVAGQSWQQVANLKDSGPSDHHYEVRMTEDGFVRCRFGDGHHGRRLPTGTNNLRIHFRQGVGPAGNLPPGNIIKPVKPHRLIEKVEQPLASSGGADMEDIETLREKAPATLLTLERAVSLEDFALLASAHSSVWQARAFALQPGRGQREKIEIVVALAQGALLQSDLKANLVDFVRSHALPGAIVIVNGYEKVCVGFKVTIRLDVNAFDKEEVCRQVKQDLQIAFSLKQRRLGQPLYRGELYKIVEGVRGVENSDCRITLPAQSFSTQPRIITGSDGVIRGIQPDARQCVHLDPVNPSIEVTSQEYSL